MPRYLRQNLTSIPGVRRNFLKRPQFPRASAEVIREKELSDNRLNNNQEGALKDRGVSNVFGCQ
ncbi:hypothetical protein EMIT0194MI4_180021 [Pseudomonas sp. IT-194MI4]